MPLSPTHKKLLRIFAALVVVGFCVYFFRNVGWSKLRSAVAGASVPLIALAATINFAHLFIKAARWRVLLLPVGRVRLLSLFRYTLGSYAASNIFPARFGEVLRIFYLRPHGIPPEGAAGVQLLEKVYEGVSLLTLCLPLPFLFPLPRIASFLIFLLAAGGVAGAVVMVWLALHHRIPRKGLLARAAEGLAILRQPRQAGFAFLLSIVVWLSDVSEVMLVLAAVGIHPSISTALLCLVFINLWIAVPSTPAQVGAFEAGGVFALGLLGVPTERALAFALIYHFMQAIPVTLAGMEALFLWRTLRAQPEPAAAEMPSPSPSDGAR